MIPSKVGSSMTQKMTRPQITAVITGSQNPIRRK